MCSREGWTCAYMPNSSITPFYLLFYTQAKHGYHEKARTETSYNRKGYGKSHSGNIIVWTHPEGWNSGVE